MSKRLRPKTQFNMISIFLYTTRAVFEPLSLNIGLTFNPYWHPCRYQNAHIMKTTAYLREIWQVCEKMTYLNTCIFLFDL